MTLATIDTSWATTSSGAGTTLTLTLPAVSAGSVVVMATTRSIGAGATPGVTSITAPGGMSWQTHAATSVRSNTHDHALHYLPVTSAISSGTTCTVTFASTSNNRAAVAAVITGVDTPHDAHSPDAIPAASTHSGANGSGASVSAITTTAVTELSCLTIGAVAYNGGQTFTPTGPGTEEEATATTTSGSGDRSVTLCFSPDQSYTSGTRSVDGGVTGGSWAATVVTFPLTDPEPPPTTPVSSVIVGGDKKVVSGMTVIVGGVKKTVTSASVIIGGVKKPAG